MCRLALLLPLVLVACAGPAVGPTGAAPHVAPVLGSPPPVAQADEIAHVEEAQALPVEGLTPGMTLDAFEARFGAVMRTCDDTTCAPLVHRELEAAPNSGFDRFDVYFVERSAQPLFQIVATPATDATAASLLQLRFGPATHGAEWRLRTRAGYGVRVHIEENRAIWTVESPADASP